MKKRAWFIVNLTDKLDKLKAKLDDFFIHIGSNHRTRDVIVNVSGVDLGEDKEEGFWKTVYYPQLLKDDSDVDYMFRLMVENNICIFLSDLLNCSIYLSVIVKYFLNSCPYC